MKQQGNRRKKAKTPLKKANKGQLREITTRYHCYKCKKGVNKVYCDIQETKNGRFKIINMWCEKCNLK